MSVFSAHRPAAEPPKPSTVVAEPATVQAAEGDYDHRSSTTSIHPSSYEAVPHTLGHK